MRKAALLAMATALAIGATTALAVTPAAGPYLYQHSDAGARAEESVGFSAKGTPLKIEGLTIQVKRLALIENSCIAHVKVQKRLAVGAGGAFSFRGAGVRGSGLASSYDVRVSGRFATARKVTGSVRIAGACADGTAAQFPFTATPRR